MSSKEYILCDNAGEVAVAVPVLSSYTHLAVDCEGDQLGCRGGRLSLLTITPISNDAPIYIFDLLRLKRKNMRRIFDLLQDDSRVKIFFDGRMDYSALWHEYAVSVAGVIDLQLADLHSRQDRGETESMRLDRIRAFLPPRMVAESPDEYQMLICLSGLARCAREHLQHDERKAIDHRKWLKRPLSQEQLGYAAQDAQLIESVYEHFKSQNYLTEELPEQSERYITFWEAGKPEKYRHFDSHCLLPLDIIDYDAGKPTHRCAGCRRFLSVDCFPDENTSSGGLYCWVCNAILRKEAYDKQKHNNSKGGGRRGRRR
ncbi:ribonuclease H-like protein [Guyanagaster necrorhizus]|uniref:Ribonuclease H-like protein n=1 Tax=Guyanagaster necrorhizus TaxID=856835 RepID=A0A9P7VQ23_9AGAR|nr:ribonuclease H-like protein [Guyanagaster necrorhizus MCA 3950]KAG7444692.1 ribonuclease H-like protein [Guyanagaster necrorhizus MCA 3950]